MKNIINYYFIFDMPLLDSTPLKLSMEVVGIEYAPRKKAEIVFIRRRLKSGLHVLTHPE